MSEEKKQKSDEIKEFGALMLNENKKNYKIRLLTIIGEIEGHETVSNLSLIHISEPTRH